MEVKNVRSPASEGGTEQPAARPVAAEYLDTVDLEVTREEVLIGIPFRPHRQKYCARSNVSQRSRSATHHGNLARIIREVG